MTKRLPFNQLAHQLIIEIAYNAVFWINCFPHKNGKHNTLSPRVIVTGSKIDFNKHYRLQFSTYIQMHEQHNNSLLPRTAGAIALCPAGNEQGGYYFLSLHMGKRVVRKFWMILPIPAEVISTVHQLAVACKIYKGITLTNKHSNIIKDDNNTEDDILGNIEITGVDGNQNITGVMQTNREGNSPESENNINNDEGNLAEDEGNIPKSRGNINNDRAIHQKMKAIYITTHLIMMLKVNMQMKYMAIHMMMTKYQLKMNHQRNHK